MSLGKVAMTARGGAKQNVSLEQGMQVPCTRYRHSEKLSGDTYEPVYLPWPAKREGKGKLPHKCTIWSSKLHELPE